MDRGGQTYYYHQNALWSPLALTDSSGNPVERYNYDVYGRVTVLNSSYNPLPLNLWGTPRSAASNAWLFTGRQLDEETGLYFYRARYYDSVKGRFLQRDALEAFNGANLYCYAGNNPASFTDPFGYSVEIAGTELKEGDKVYNAILGPDKDLLSAQLRLNTLINSGKKYIFKSQKSFEDYRKLESIAIDTKEHLAETRKAAENYLDWVKSPDRAEGDKRVKALKEEARKEKDPDKRKVLYGQAEVEEKTNSGWPLYKVYDINKERLQSDQRAFQKMDSYLKKLKSLDARTEKLLEDTAKLDSEGRDYLASSPVNTTKVNKTP
jgi:RHS repeat-associated protein